MQPERTHNEVSYSVRLKASCATGSARAKFTPRMLLASFSPVTALDVRFYSSYLICAQIVSFRLADTRHNVRNVILFIAGIISACETEDRTTRMLSFISYSVR